MTNDDGVNCTQDEAWTAAAAGGGEGDVTADKSRGRTLPRDPSSRTPSSSRRLSSSTSYEAISSFTRRSHISVIPKMYVSPGSHLTWYMAAPLLKSVGVITRPVHTFLFSNQWI